MIDKWPVLSPNGDMSNRIRLATIFEFYVAGFIVLIWFSLTEFVDAEINDHAKLFPQQDEGKVHRSDSNQLRCVK